MRNLAKAIVLLVSMLVLLTAASCRKPDAKSLEAVEAADAWLALVDSGEYGKSWEESAEYFRNAVAKDQWMQQLPQVRDPMGKMNARKMMSTKYATSLPGAPDGEYVVIQYATSFENNMAAVETVTPMKEKDGTWRVSGYYIK